MTAGEKEAAAILLIAAVELYNRLPWYRRITTTKPK